MSFHHDNQSYFGSRGWKYEAWMGVVPGNIVMVNDYPQ
jgi:hypothetical protein